MILEAISFATEAHHGQTRKWGSNEPYINHPIRVEMHCRQYTDDTNTLAAAVLHDVPEDCDVSFKELSDRFGTSVSFLVFEVTNPSKKFPKLRRADRKKMDLDHLASASLEAQIIKSCDRIDNLKSMLNAPLDFIELYAYESRLLSEVLTKVPQELFDELMKEILIAEGRGVYLS